MKCLLMILLTAITGTLMAGQSITRAVYCPFAVMGNDTIRPMIVDPKQRLQRMEGRYSHTTSKGRVYIMSPDNMPCLVPNEENLAPMPGTHNKLRIKPVMPNTLPVVPLIPKTKSQGNQSKRQGNQL